MAFFIMQWLTIYIIGVILTSMMLSNYYIIDRENLSLIYSGLDSISNKGRERLKKIAESLVVMQNRPGTPIPDSICREIMGSQKNELLSRGKL
jgi:hypothetical protein